MTWTYLKYGAMVISGITITGSLVYFSDRPTVHLVDEIELLEGANERLQALYHHCTTTNYYTSAVSSEVGSAYAIYNGNDSKPFRWISTTGSYASNNLVVTTNYYSAFQSWGSNFFTIKSTASATWAPCYPQSRAEGTALGSQGSAGLDGFNWWDFTAFEDEGKRAIWNCYTSLTVSGFSDLTTIGANGIYNFDHITNVYVSGKEETIWMYNQISDTNYWFYDFGPRFSGVVNRPIVTNQWDSGGPNAGVPASCYFVSQPALITTNNSGRQSFSFWAGSIVSYNQAGQPPDHTPNWYRANNGSVTIAGTSFTTNKPIVRSFVPTERKFLLRPIVPQLGLPKTLTIFSDGEQDLLSLNMRQALYGERIASAWYSLGPIWINEKTDDGWDGCSDTICFWPTNYLTESNMWEELKLGEYDQSSSVYLFPDEGYYDPYMNEPVITNSSMTKTNWSARYKLINRLRKRALKPTSLNGNPDIGIVYPNKYGWGYTNGIYRAGIGYGWSYTDAKQMAEDNAVVVNEVVLRPQNNTYVECWLRSDGSNSWTVSFVNQQAQLMIGDLTTNIEKSVDLYCRADFAFPSAYSNWTYGTFTCVTNGYGLTIGTPTGDVQSCWWYQDTDNFGLDAIKTWAGTFGDAYATITPCAAPTKTNDINIRIEGFYLRDENAAIDFTFGRCKDEM